MDAKNTLVAASGLTLLFLYLFSFYNLTMMHQVSLMANENEILGQQVPCTFLYETVCSSILPNLTNQVSFLTSQHSLLEQQVCPDACEIAIET